MSNIDFSKYIPGQSTALTKKSSIDFSKYIPKSSVVASTQQIKPVESDIKTVYLPSGGVFKTKAGEPNTLIKTERSNYGGLPVKTGLFGLPSAERADIAPVSLGGVNSSPENITYEKYPLTERLKDLGNKVVNSKIVNTIFPSLKSKANLANVISKTGILPDFIEKPIMAVTSKEYIPQTKTDKYLKEEILPAYKSGKITLREAQGKAISYLQNEQSGIKQGVIANLPSATLDTVTDLYKGIAEGITGEKKKYEEKPSFSATKLFPKEYGKQIGSTLRSFGEGFISTYENLGSVLAGKNVAKSQQYIQGNIEIQNKILQQAHAEKDATKKKKLLGLLTGLNDFNAELIQGLDATQPSNQKIIGNGIQAIGEAIMYGGGKVPAPVLFGGMSFGSALSQEKSAKEIAVETLKGALTGQLLHYAGKFKTPVQRVLASGGTLAFTGVLDAIGQNAPKEEVLKAGLSNFLIGVAFAASGERTRALQEKKFNEIVNKYVNPNTIKQDLNIAQTENKPGVTIKNKPTPIFEFKQKESKSTTQSKIDFTKYIETPEAPVSPKIEPTEVLKPKEVQTTAKAKLEPEKVKEPLITEAKKAQSEGKTLEEFIKTIKENPEKIPTTPEYQKYLKEQDAFIKREKEIYAEMSAMRDKYVDKTINEVPASEITKYDNLQKELSQSLSKKTLAKSPEGVIKTHIGEKGLESQLTDIWNKVQEKVQPKVFNKTPKVENVVNDITTKLKGTGIIKDVKITNKRIMDKTQNIESPVGTDPISRTTYINKDVLTKDIKDLVENKLPEFKRKKNETNKQLVDRYVEAIVREESKHPQNITVEQATRIAKGEGFKVSKELEQKYVAEKPKQAKLPLEKTEKFKSRVFDRMKAEHPELEGDLMVDRRKMDKDIDNAVDLISKDKQKAYDIAMGREVSDVVTATNTNIVLAEKALAEGNISLFTKLITNRSLAQTRRGQELVAEKGSVTDNSVSKYVKELISIKLDKLGEKYLSDVTDIIKRKSIKEKATKKIDKEVQNVEEKIKNKKLDAKTALALLDKLTCLT